MKIMDLFKEDRRRAFSVVEDNRNINIVSDWSNPFILDFTNSIKVDGFIVKHSDIVVGNLDTQSPISFKGIIKYSQYVEDNEILSLIETGVISDEVQISQCTKSISKIEVENDVLFNMVSEKTKRKLQEIENLLEKERAKLTKKLHFILLDNFQFLTSDEEVINTLIKKDIDF